MMNLGINILQNDVGYTVQLNGEIDAYTASDLKNKIMPIANEKEVHIVVDFTEVEYMDSTGLGVFIALLKAVKKTDGKLEFIGVSKRLKRLFDITGLTEILNLNSNFEKVERR
ncbi:STAS domain-containing protein [Bacillus pacificus]|nr:STAS domain-containing protein [Bacillus pacificus]